MYTHGETNSTHALSVTVGLKHNAANKGALERIGYAYLTSPLTGVNGSPIIRISSGKMIQNIFTDLYCTQREVLKIRTQM